MTKKHLPTGLDGRTRDQHSPKSGQIREKRADTKVGTLRQEYGQDFAAGVRSDMKLGTLREREGKTLSQMVKDAKK